MRRSRQIPPCLSFPVCRRNGLRPLHWKVSCRETGWPMRWNPWLRPFTRRRFSKNEPPAGLPALMLNVAARADAEWDCLRSCRNERKQKPGRNRNQNLFWPGLLLLIAWSDGDHASHRWGTGAGRRNGFRRHGFRLGRKDHGRLGVNRAVAGKTVRSIGRLAGFSLRRNHKGSGNL